MKLHLHVYRETKWYLDSKKKKKMLETPKWQGQGILLSYTCTGLNKPLGLHDVKVPMISRQSAHKGEKAVNPMHRPPLPPSRYRRDWFLLETESTPGP